VRQSLTYGVLRRKIGASGGLRTVEYDLSMASRAPAQPRVLLLIAAFKLLKGLVLFAVGVGALRLLSQGAAKFRACPTSMGVCRY